MGLWDLQISISRPHREGTSIKLILLNGHSWEARERREDKESHSRLLAMTRVYTWDLTGREPTPSFLSLQLSQGEGGWERPDGTLPSV